LLIFFLSTVPLFAQDTPVSPVGTQVATEQTPAAAVNTDSLRNAAENPIASLISVPMQDNFNFNSGPADRTQNILNIQPVIPVNVGPTLVLPTATNTTLLGQGKFSMGPSVVVLVQPKPWTMGFLANNIWSVAGHSDLDKPAVNQFLLQWFVNYNMKKGWYLNTSPIVTANWRATSGRVWTVPFGGGVGRIMKLGFQPVNVTAQVYGNAFHPPGAPRWGLRLQFVLLFPKLTKEQEKALLE
jgi:hypothetical protein